MRTSSGGFSLIEVLVVMAIIALMAGMALPSISSYFEVSLNSAARELGTTIKEAYSSAAIGGKMYRIVYDIDKNQYWVESGGSTDLLETEESLRKKERRQKSSSSEKEQGKKPSKYSLDTTITRKKRDLPRDVAYEDLITLRSKEPLTAGVEYTYIFPQGLTQQTIIHLKDSANHHVTLVIPPLSGNTDVYNRYVSQDDIFEK